MLIIAGAYNGGMIQPENIGNYNPVVLIYDILGFRFGQARARRSAYPHDALAISSFPRRVFRR